MCLSRLSVSSGDHVICGSYDCRLSWFDLDLSTKPYKMLRYGPVYTSINSIDHVIVDQIDVIDRFLFADTIRRQ